LFWHNGHIYDLNNIKLVFEQGLAFIDMDLAPMLRNERDHFGLGLFYLLGAHCQTALFRDVAGLETFHFVDISESTGT
jgi:hypothetical protein